MSIQIVKNVVLNGADNRPFLADVYSMPDGKPKPVVIFCHGFKGFKDWGHFHLVARAFAEAGFVFVKFNFSHNGTTIDQPTDFADLEAFGNNNFSRELFDLGEVINWVDSGDFPVPASEINAEEKYLIGHSRGGGIVVLKAAQDQRVKKLCTWASVSEYGKYWASKTMQEWREKGVMHVLNGRTGQQMPLYWQMYEDFYANKNKLDVPKAASQLSTPFLVVHGTNDKAVPFSSAESLHSWAKDSQLLRIENGDHTFGGRHPWEADVLPKDSAQVVQETIHFFEN